MYDQLFRRKSFHKFGETVPMSEGDCQALQEAVGSLKPLVDDIEVKVKVVSEEETNCRRGAEKCVLFYSEDKPNAMMNIGYMGEQLDLMLVEKGIGTLWYGLGKTDEKSFEGLGFVIMIAVAKVPEGSFRRDMFKAKRKDVSEIWEGPRLPLTDIVRFAPSACNSQPWYVKNMDGVLKVFRFRKKGFTGLIPMAFVARYNRIDIGIFLYVLELCMAHDGIEFERTLFIDDSADDVAYTPVAEYRYGGSSDERIN